MHDSSIEKGFMSRSEKESTVQVGLHVPLSTILVIIGTAAVLFILYKVAAILLLIAIPNLLAITLYPLLKKMRSIRIPGSGLIVTTGVLAILGLAVVLIIPL